MVSLSQDPRTAVPRPGLTAVMRTSVLWLHLTQGSVQPLTGSWLQMNLMVTGLWDLGAAWKRKGWRRVLQVQAVPSDKIALGSKVSSCLLGVLIKVFFPKGRKTDPGCVLRLGTNETEEHHFPLWNKNSSTHHKATSSHLPGEWKGTVFKSLPCSYNEMPILQLLEHTMTLVVVCKLRP